MSAAVLRLNDRSFSSWPCFSIFQHWIYLIVFLALFYCTLTATSVYLLFLQSYPQSPSSNLAWGSAISFPGQKVQKQNSTFCYHQLACPASYGTTAVWRQSPQLCLSIYDLGCDACAVAWTVAGARCRENCSSSSGAVVQQYVQIIGVRNQNQTGISIMGCNQATSTAPPTQGIKPSQTPCTPQDIAKYLNDIRANPRKYALLLQKQLQASFKDYYSIKISEDVLYRTNQGKKAWEEAIEFLQKVEPLPALQIHGGLCKAAGDHAQDLANQDQLSHVGSDGSQPLDRVVRYCRKGLGKTGENIGTDFNLKDRNFAEATVVGLVVDDGVTDRGHRLSVFDKDFVYFGSASRVQDKEKGDKVITVINYLSKNWDPAS